MDADLREQHARWLREHCRARRSIAVLTGAGISAESGLPTFRGDDGLWRQSDPMALFTPEALARTPDIAWGMYDELRLRIARAEPNAGHHALAALERHAELTLATQNIDGLHQRAGSTRVLELHGTMWRLRCESCAFAEENTQAPLPTLPPRCPSCGMILRPDIVLFGEPLPADALEGAWEAAERCDLMLVVGTSGVVYPAAAIPGIARRQGALTIEINPEETALSAEMDHIIRAPAADALPWVVEALSIA